MQALFKILATFTVVALAAIATPGALAADPASDDYRPAIGDRLSITAFGRADLTGEFAIGGDAAIRLPLVGGIPAAGRSRGEIEADVTKRLSELLGYDILVTVDVAVYRPVFVIGDVITPGEVIYMPGMTALQAYAKAGGAPSARQLPSQVATQMATAQRDIMVAQDELNAFLLHRAALDAALADRAEIALPDELKAVAHTPAIAATLAAEKALLGAQREGMGTRATLLASERKQLGEEVAALEQQIVSLQRHADAVAEELRRIGGLAEQGLATSQRVLELKRSKSATDSSRYEAIAFLARAKQEIVQVDLRAHEFKEVQRRERLEQRRLIEGEITRARARADGAARQMAALSQLNLAALTSGKGEITFAISRNEPGGARSIAAVATTPLQPGDIVQVTIGEGRPANAALPPRQAALAAPAAE